jgi:hypothetical protein
MAVPRDKRFPVEHDDIFPLGALIVGEVGPVMEYLSREDRARGRTPKQQTDPVSGLLLWELSVADPAAQRKSDKAVTVQVAALHQPIPPEGVAGLPVRMAVFEGLTVSPRLEGQGEYKRIGWVLRATGMRPVAGGQGSGRATARVAAGESKAA